MTEPSNPTCPYGHGALLEQEGWWVLQGVAPKQTNALTALVSKPNALVPNGKALALQAWRCPSCGAVQLFDIKAP
jgi:hypothetical protein